MIKTRITNADLFGNIGEFKITQYYGQDAIDFANNHEREDIRNWILEYLHKDCITSNKEIGTVIGIEDNEEFDDYYLIIYVPEIKEVRFDLAAKLI